VKREQLVAASSVSQSTAQMTTMSRTRRERLLKSMDFY
jgi:hypothetical protein